MGNITIVINCDGKERSWGMGVGGTREMERGRLFTKQATHVYIGGSEMCKYTPEAYSAC